MNIRNLEYFIKVVDTTSPTITINNCQNLTLEVGDTYIDEGATAYDLVDGDLTDKIEVSYLYYDSEGNKVTPNPTEIVLDKEGQFVIIYKVYSKMAMIINYLYNVNPLIIKLRYIDFLSIPIW